MHIILDNNGNYVGEYLRIKDDKYTVKMFTKYYNMFINDSDFFITAEEVKNLLRMSKYNITDNNIYINDINSGQLIFKSLSIGLNMVWIAKTKKLYLLNEKELKEFIDNNIYKSETSISYVFGLPDIYKFKNVGVIVSNNITNAKEIYKEMYSIEEDPIFIGFKEDDYLYISLDSKSIAALLDDDIL